MGILQVRILGWVALPSSRGSSQSRDWTRISYVSSIGRWFFITSTWEAEHFTWEEECSTLNQIILLSKCPEYEQLDSSFQSLSRVWLFVTPWATACQASLSITNSQSLPNSCPLSRWCHPDISSSVIPFSSCLQSFPESRSLQTSQLFTSGGQSIGVSASASVLPMNIQDWFPLGWVEGSPCSPKNSRVFSNTTIQKHQFFSAQLSL